MGSRKRFSAALLASILLVAALATARPADAQKASSTAAFAVLDIQRILRESAATRAIRPQIEKLKSRYEKEFKRQEQELRAANQDLARQRAILSPEAYAERRKAFQRRATRAQREVQATKRMLDQALGRAMGKVHRALRQVTAELARERKLNLILPRSAVLLVETRFDLTTEVLKRLNARLPSVTVNLPEQTQKPAAGKKK